MQVAAEDYFSSKHGLTRTHSEVIEAVDHVSAGRALDLGCGSGRNSLYLKLKGFDVEAWDRSPNSLDNLRRIVAEEGMQGFDIREVDLDAAQVTGQYDFILSTVVMMFLQPATIPGLIAQMRKATLPGGCNLIVSAMDTPDLPCPVPFPFRFQPGELRNYYADWQILKYNENMGQLHRTDAQGNRIAAHFATLLARRPG